MKRTISRLIVVALIAVLAGVLQALRRRSADLRYRWACWALLLMAALPVVDGAGVLVGIVAGDAAGAVVAVADARRRAVHDDVVGRPQAQVHGAGQAAGAVELDALDGQLGGASQRRSRVLRGLVPRPPVGDNPWC